MYDNSRYCFYSKIGYYQTEKKTMHLVLDLSEPGSPSSIQMTTSVQRANFAIANVCIVTKTLVKLELRDEMVSSYQQDSSSICIHVHLFEIRTINSEFFSLGSINCELDTIP